MVAAQRSSYRRMCYNGLLRQVKTAVYIKVFGQTPNHSLPRKSIEVIEKTSAQNENGTVEVLTRSLYQTCPDGDFSVPSCAAFHNEDPREGLALEQTIMTVPKLEAKKEKNIHKF